MAAIYVPPGYEQLFPISVNLVLDFGADPTGTNDCTVNVQAAINAVDATGQSATIWVPPGTYKLSGPIISTNMANSQVVLPSTDNTGTHAPVIVFKGTNEVYYERIGGQATFITTATNGWMFGIGGPSTSPAPALVQGGYFSYTVVRFKDIVFLTGDNPTMGALNLGRAFAAQVKRCNILNSYSAPSSAPTNASQVGLIMPYIFNGGPAYNLVEDVAIAGQYVGAQISEHATVRMKSTFNTYGLQLGPAEHLIKIEMLDVENTVYGLSGTTKDPYSDTNTTRFVCYMTLEQNTSGPWAGGYSFYDPNNACGGQLFYCANHNSDLHGAFTWSGGTGVVMTSLSPGGANP